MNRLKHLYEERAAKEDAMKKIMTDCENEKRNRTESERLKWQSLKKEVDDMKTEIDDLEKQQLIDLRTAKPVKGIENRGGEIENEGDGSEMRFLDFQIREKVPVNRKMPATDFALRNYDIDERMKKANVYAVIAGLAGRKYPAGSVTDWALNQEKRSLTSSALLNPYLSAQLLDGGLAKSRLVQAGMRTFVMHEGVHKFARIDSYPELEWKAEKASTTERTATFNPVTFTAKTLRGWIEIGGETLMDALNIEQQLRTVFNRSIANGVDTAGLIGAGGADEPLGIANYVGVPTVTWNDNLDDYDAWVAAQKLVYDEDGPDLTATIMSPDAWSQLARLKGTAEFQPVNPPHFLRDHLFLQTSKIEPDGGSETLAVLGGFESLNLGIRLQAEIMMTPVIAETFSYKMLAVFRGDFQPNRVEDFAVITDITAAPPLT